ncbi:MAG: VCBS repeat-containing protein [Ahniella sp.]|nr:VCBS repeat-containing protein [Ahniella sp.]
MPTKGQWRDGFDLADFNDDGILDLAHGPARKGRAEPAIWLGTGTGQFRLWSDTHFPPLPYDYGDLIIGDVNADGLPDLALGSHLRGLTVLINETRGHFAPWAEGLDFALPSDNPQEPIFASRALAFADWNRDGRLDLIAQNEGRTLFGGDRLEPDALRVYLNRNRSWQLLGRETTAQGFGDALAVADLDGDGQPEALTGSRDVGAQRLLHYGFGGTPQSVTLPGLPSRAVVTAVQIDAATAGKPGKLWFGSTSTNPEPVCTELFQMDWTAGGATTPRRVAAHTSRDAWRKILRHDLNEDGQTDLMAITETGMVEIHLANAKGLRFDSSWPASISAGCQTFDAALADLDGKPGLELLVSYAGEDDPTVQSACPGQGGFAGFHVTPRKSRR